MLDYYRYPEWRSSWGGPMNGQSHRQKMVEMFLRQLSFDAIVETGTYRGTTTAYLASLSSVPVYTVELNPRAQGFAFLALRRFKNVRRYGGDSRRFLRMLAADPALGGKRLFFYLDAHWADDLPLAEELDIIFGHWGGALVLIDDFQVPDDQRYGYDDYGPGKALTLDYLAPAIRTYRLHTFFPSVASDREAGERRGCVVLAADRDVITTLRTMPAVRELVVDGTSYAESRADASAASTGPAALASPSTPGTSTPRRPCVDSIVHTHLGEQTHVETRDNPAADNVGLPMKTAS